MVLDYAVEASDPSCEPSAFGGLPDTPRQRRDRPAAGVRLGAALDAGAARARR
jgi:hypothetical protein